MAAEREKKKGVILDKHRKAQTGNSEKTVVRSHRGPLATLGFSLPVHNPKTYERKHGGGVSQTKRRAAPKESIRQGKGSTKRQKELSGGAAMLWSPEPL